MPDAVDLVNQGDFDVRLVPDSSESEKMIGGQQTTLDPIVPKMGTCHVEVPCS